MFTVYMNLPNRRIVVHAESCSNVKKRGGVSHAYPPTGWYCEPFADREGAHWLANRMEHWTNWDQYVCSECNG